MNRKSFLAVLFGGLAAAIKSFKPAAPKISTSIRPSGSSLMGLMSNLRDDEDSGGLYNWWEKPYPTALIRSANKSNPFRPLT